VASIKLFERSGFEKCGVLKDWVLYNGRWHDVVMMQIISSSI
jgi:RimJ/RimL family protein N-acetyltransferase